MFEGLPREWRAFTPSLIVTKTDHIGKVSLGRNVVALESSHPVPDQSSLIAGKKVLGFVQGCGPESRLLILLSGGASSLVEHLKEGGEYAQLVDATQSALGMGADIAEINRRRKELSAVKGGKLLASFMGEQVHVLAISDVGGDGIDVIGSGLGACPDSPDFDYSVRIIASNVVAREAVVRDAQGRGLTVIANEETMYADVAEVAAQIALDVRDGPCGLYLYGGEPTVILPKNPGQGGRNQALALELARHFRNRSDVSGLVAGTDGTDGPTDAAGAFLDGDTFDMEPGADEALTRANSACYLARTGDQIITGPTGTNVMDLAILIKHK
ncbi:MOFRL family protein [Sedimentitalea sp. CY04]|uniref:MOFRL family protein n=1 Tax=Parasedimentitalea denitrificans TaxID=2211118 RepID=A0ABX0W7S1_9RHOB|nr:DUF4147 domain-containing protein [Sedimentitalea sp. CY04]NIZ61689.1 MOFRL family protein [Sedimentitalea sp. CY04]